jgi:hypothetical protein
MIEGGDRATRVTTKIYFTNAATTAAFEQNLFYLFKIHAPP